MENRSTTMNPFLTSQLRRNWRNKCETFHVVHNVDCLDPVHTRTSDICVSYSGGLESSVIGTTYPDTVDFLCLQNLEYYRQHLNTYGVNYKFVESVIPIIAKYLGYSSVVIGEDGGRDYPHLQELSLPYFNTHSHTVGINIISPLSLLDKWKIFKIAIENNLSFYSCMNANEANSYSWCGHCFKCFQIATFCKSLGLYSGYTYSGILDYIYEIKQFRKDGIEHWEGDCYSFISMENDTGVLVEDIWS